MVEQGLVFDILRQRSISFKITPVASQKFPRTKLGKLCVTQSESKLHTERILTKAFPLSNTAGISDHIAIA